MRIGMILDVGSDLADDLRVNKEASALCGAGFDVALLAGHHGSEHPPEETLDYGLKVSWRPVPAPALGRRLMLALSWMLRPWSYYRQWAGVIADFVERARPDVLHVHDLPIVPTALAVARDRGIAVVADLHENMPAAQVVCMRAWPIWHRARFHLTREYRRWRHMERTVLRQCARIIAVVPEGTRRIIDDYGVPADRVFVVSNTEDETTYDPGPPDADILGRYRDCWMATYVGGMGAHRGTDTAIRAAAIAGRRIERFKLVIVGVNPAAKGALSRLVGESGAGSDVELVDRVPRELLSSYIAASDACLVPHNDFEHTQTTVPHKLFHYMMTGKPVVVSSCAPLKRIVEATRSGLVFRANDPADLARCLVELHENKDGCAEAFGRNGREAALGPFAWCNDAATLVEMYRRLEAETRGPPGRR